ncbi:MAG: hypothetical protein QM692_09260 [Thermomicrobiales bacterium]
MNDKRCTLVWEYNAGESALYDEAGKRIFESKDTLDLFDAHELGCGWVKLRKAIVDGDGCAIYECTEFRGFDFVDYDCKTVWPETLDESWLIPEDES